MLDEERALWSCILLAVFPFSWVFSMAYGESLFLALSLGSLLAAERGRAGWASVLASLAGLTRPQGVLLIVPLALILWRRVRRIGGDSCGWRLVPAGALGFLGWVGGPDRESQRVQPGPGRLGAQRGRLRPRPAGRASVPTWTRLLATFLVTLLAYVFLLVYLRPDRIPLAYALIPVLALASVFASGNLQSIGRLGMVAFPFAWVLAGRRVAWFRIAWPAVSAGLLVVLSVAIFAGWYQP